MKDDVKACVESRIQFIDTYIQILPDTQQEITALISAITALGEQCADFEEFEERFAAEGLQNRFYALAAAHPAKSHPMTREEKRFAADTFRRMISENKGQILADAASDAATHARLSIESEVYAKRREHMIEEGTFDEYTRACNAKDDAGRLFGFLRRRLKK